MGYEDFICAAQAQMQEKLGEGVRIQLHQIMKNNAILLDALSISEGEGGIAPTIYLNDFYRDYLNGVSMPDIVGRMTELYQKSRLKGKFDISFYTDYEKVKTRLACRLINREKNRQLLKRVPYRPFLDLAVVVYYCFEDERLGSGTILVYESHRRNWNVSLEELFDTARENTLRLQPVEFVNMHRILERYCGGKQEEEGIAERDMYVLTNKSNYFGAAGILFDSVLQDIAKELGGDFWVLPSSIHECVIVPGSLPMTEEELGQMVREINQSEVDEEDYLSDNVYLYRKELHRLSR